MEVNALFYFGNCNEIFLAFAVTEWQKKLDEALKKIDEEKMRPLRDRYDDYNFREASDIIWTAAAIKLEEVAERHKVSVKNDTAAECFGEFLRSKNLHNESIFYGWVSAKTYVW